MVFVLLEGKTCSLVSYNQNKELLKIVSSAKMVRTSRKKHELPSQGCIQSCLAVLSPLGRWTGMPHATKHYHTDIWKGQIHVFVAAKQKNLQTTQGNANCWTISFTDTYGPVMGLCLSEMRFKAADFWIPQFCSMAWVYHRPLLISWYLSGLWNNEEIKTRASYPAAALVDVIN